VAVTVTTVTEKKMERFSGGRETDSASGDSKCAAQFRLEAWAKANHFRHQLEESYRHEKPEVRSVDRRCYEQIPTSCGGFIGLYQESPTVILQFYTPSARKLCRKVLERFADKGLWIDDWFDGWEAVIYFPPEILLEVCQMVGARRRKQGRPLTEDQKAAFAVGRKRGLAALHRGGKSLLSEPSEIRGEAQGGG
jgi:hypothetical protein